MPNSLSFRALQEIFELLPKTMYCGGSETPCNIARYYVMIVHCMISVLFLVYKLAYFGIQLTNTVSVFST